MLIEQLESLPNIPLKKKTLENNNRKNVKKSWMLASLMMVGIYTVQDAYVDGA